VLIVCGLYVVLWGKGKEMKMNTQPPDSSDQLVDIAIHPPTELNVTVTATTTAKLRHFSSCSGHLNLVAPFLSSYSLLLASREDEADEDKN
jgi:hypothetical protein